MNTEYFFSYWVRVFQNVGKKMIEVTLWRPYFGVFAATSRCFFIFPCSFLVLELGSNRIRKIENLEPLVNLEELYLGRNKITKLENLDSCTKLRLISIQSNRIVKLEGKVPSQKLLRPNPTESDRRILPDLVGFGRIWSDLVGFGRIWSDSVGFGRIWSDLVGFGRILVGVAPGRGPP